MEIETRAPVRREGIMPKITPPELGKMLIDEATRWIGIREEGGDNHGAIVEMFQKKSGAPLGVAWCMCFVQFCAQAVDNLKSTFYADSAPELKLPKGAACLDVWHRAPEEFKSQNPSPGAVVIWRHGQTYQGHAGIVVSVNEEAGTFETIEGNTSSADHVERNGDGVYRKIRKLHPTGEMELVGFIYPWG